MSISVGTLQLDMAMNLARLASDVAQAKGMLGNFEKAAVASANTIKTAFGALGVGLSLAGLVEMGRKAIDAADHINDLSKTTRIAVDDLAGLQLAAKQSGSDLDTIAASVGKLSQNIGKDPEKFTRLGVTAKEPIKALQQLAEVFSQIQDPQLRAAVAAEALGKSWQAAAPLLSEGGSKIAEMVKRGKELSGITKESAEQADAFNDKLAEMETAFGKTKNKVIGDMLPSFTEIAKAVTQAAEDSGKLTAAWVALGGAAALVLGKTEAQQLKARIADVNLQLDTARKQLSAGTLNPNGASKSIFAFLIPDVKLTDDALKTLTETIKQLEKEKRSLQATPITLSAFDAGQNNRELNRVTTLSADQKAQNFLTGTLKEEQIAAAHAKNLLDIQLDFLATQGQVNEADYKAGAQTLKGYYDLRLSIIDRSLQAQESGIAGQITAQQAIENNALKSADERTAAHIKIEELGVQLQKAATKAVLDRTVVTREAERAVRDFNMAQAESAARSIQIRMDEKDAALALTGQLHNTLSQQAQDAAFQLKLYDQERASLGTLALSYGEQQNQLLQLNIARETEIQLQKLKIDQTATLAQLNSSEFPDAAAIQRANDFYAKRASQIPGEVVAAQTALADINNIRATQDEIRSVNDSLGHDLADAITSGFDGGTSAAKKFLANLKDLFKRQVLSPTIQFLLQPITGAIAGTLGSLGLAGPASAANAGGGAGGILNLLSAGKNVSDLFSGNSLIGRGLTSVGNFFGIGGASSAGLGFSSSGALISGGLGASGIGAGLGFAGEGAIAASSGGLGLSSAGLGGLLAGGEVGSAAGAGIGLSAAAVDAGAIGAGAAGAGAALSAIASAIPYVGIAIAVASALGLFGGSKKISARDIDSGGLGFTEAGSQFFSRGSQGAMDIATAVSKGLQDAASSLGATLPSYGIGFGSNTGHQGENPNFSLSASVGTGTDYGNQRNVFASGEEMGQSNKLDQTTIALRSGQALLAVLRESDMPAYLKQFFDALKPVADMSADDVSNALAFAQQLKSAHDLLQKIADISGIKATADDLIKLFGNIQTAAPLIQSYYENFYTQAEQQAAGMKQVADAMTALGVTAIPKTREEFRKLVEAQDLTTDAGKSMFQALIAVAPAFAAASDAMTDTTAAARDQQAVLDDLVSGWGDVAKTLREYAAELAGGVPGSSSYASTRSTFNAVSMSARLGDIEAAKKLKDAGEAFRTASLATRGSAVEYARDLALIRSGVNGAITTADQQVSIAQKQLDELRNITAALGGTPGHAGGLDYVPYDNYLMRAHQGEAVLTASEASRWRSGGAMVSGADLRALLAQNTELVGEVKAMRAENNSGNLAIARHVSKSAKLQDKADFEAQAVTEAATTSVNASATTRTLVRANANRRGLMLVNTDPNTAYVKFGIGASLTSWSFRLLGDSTSYYEMPADRIYSGRIDVIWAADGGGKMMVTET